MGRLLRAMSPGSDSTSTRDTMTEHSAYDEFLGNVFGDRYRIDSVLGSGSMGGVFRATDQRTQIEVAVKMLDPVLLSEPSIREELIKRFQREIKTTQALNHPNIVKLYDSGTHDGDKLYLVLELLDGVDLEEHPLGVPMAPQRVSRLAHQIAAALSAAHEQGIVHRDLKPGNILLVSQYGRPDVVKVVDFGIARMLESHHEVTAVTKAGTTVGTPRYMAPEQAMAQPVSAMTDLYALGAIIYELLTGRQMFYADNEMMIALSHINEPPPQLAVPGMDDLELARWQTLLSALLQKDPADRPQSGAEVIQMLREVTPGLPDPVEQLRAGAAAEASAASELVDVSVAQDDENGPRDTGMLWVLAAVGVAVLGAVIAMLVGN